MLRRFILVFILLCRTLLTASAAVTVSSGSGGTSICSNKAVTGSAPGYTSLGPITITEVASSDFAAGTDVIVLNPPSGWRFSTTLPSITFITGSNITGVSGSITSSALTINVSVSAVTGADQITITGLQVQPLTTSASTGNVYASSVTGVTGISTGTGGTNFATLSITSPLTASVSIAATPTGAFCPGTHVTFIPTSANGGTPTYTWSVNGVPVSIGTTFSSATLSSGNTISCRMNSSLGCLVTNPVYSNTITATVLSAPAALSGSNYVCPGNTTTLSTTSTGGAWSSSNTSVATVSGGVVTGVAAGTSKISYTAGGCAATKVIYVNNHPFAPVLTPTVSTICDAGSLTITASGTPASTAILSQDFNSGIAPWTVDTAGSIAILPGSEWKACADSYLNEQGWYRSPDFTTFAMANADTSGSSSTLSSTLTSPEFSLAEYAAATLTFQHSYDYWPAGDVYVNLEISTNGGTTWTTINNFVGETIGSKMGFVSESFSLNAYLGNPHVKIRFYYYSTFGYYWAIDNIAINGVPGVVIPTWSPTTYLYTDPSYTTPYTSGTQASTVYLHPSTVSTPTAITYTATATTGTCSSSATSAVTVNPAPGTTLGALNLCVGTTTTLSNTAAGGTWVSANTSIATVASGTGVVTGVAAGTATISYILGTSCAAVAVVTVNTTPAAISGASIVCLGYEYTYTDATTGGTWSSSNTSVATIGSSTGIVSGVAAGVTNLYYSLGAGCTVSKTVTVHPSPAAISGPMELCEGDTVTVTNTTSGGIWVSGATGIATIGYYTGEVIGVSDGTVNITYGMPTTGCLAISEMTVNPIGPITGSGDACIGYATPLENIGGAGTWVSGNTSVATIGSSSGIVTGVAIGTADITYTSGGGCVAHAVITVNTLPPDISGTAEVCIGQTTTLSNSVEGGTWSSANPSVASVGSTTGVVSGNTAGTVLITYTAPTTCIKTIVVTVQPLPAAITGVAAICNGFTSALSNATGGGTWSSSNTAVATISGTGVVSAASVGTSTITYTLPTGCYATRGVTVNPLPAAITGATSVCQGLTTNLSNTSAGGTWSSSYLVVATVNSTSGVVLGGAAGTAAISYTLPTGCVSSTVVTVNPLPASVTGSSSVCTGATTTLSSATSGGTWSSSNGSIATVGTDGVVSGVSSGNVAISYTLPTGCYSVKNMTVNMSPASITGTAGVCVGAVTTLSIASSGGVWSSSSPSVATIVSATGVATGVAAGTTNITYMLSTGCIATREVTVLPLPASISGSLALCLTNTTTLSNGTGGGTWSSSNTSVATIGSSSGAITGVGLGSTTVSYTLPTGCYTTSIAVVNPLPAVVSGASSICEGSTTVYTNGTTGGVWSSSNTIVANIGSSSGAVTGVGAGTTAISYTLPTGCASVKVVTVNPLPEAISGAANICEDAYTTMTNPTGGGIWTSSTISVATIGSASGVVFGEAGGVAVITYTLATGCRTVKAVTVTSLPAAIAGPVFVCEGSTILMTESTTGGSWISSNPGVATIGSSGLVTGVSAGSSTISYMLPLGCLATKNITVNPVPAAITGDGGLCIGTPELYESATSGGGWASSNPSIVSITTSTGVATGTVYGTASISYVLPTGCYATRVVTVNLTPSVISGANSVCEGLTTAFSNVVGGGTWTSNNPAIAAVAPSTGIVSGVSAGTARISYTLSTGCYATKLITVNPVPETITGPAAICQGLSGTLSTASTGGTWSSGNTFVAVVGVSSGVVNGVTPGTANITYKFPTGCLTSRVLTVHALPSALSGSPNLCTGGSTTLSTTSGGGSWTSSNTSVATVDGSGVVTALTTGTSSITYTLGIGCSVSRVVTVHPNPSAPTGGDTTCLGIPLTLSNTEAGGVWSTTTSGIATVGSATGLVTPVSPGIATITYTLGTGCYSTKSVLVNTVSPISGNTSICVGSVSMLSHAIPGGTWSSSNTAAIGISPTSGLAVGYSVNTATISYVLPMGCIATTVATVSTPPSAIIGPSNVCPGFSVSLANAVTGGSWSSSNGLVATIGSASGVVTGVSPGLVAINYTLPSGCAVSRVMTVNALPADITGADIICAGNSAVLSIAASGGTWSSSNVTVAGVSAPTGVVSGLSAGTAIITYTPASGCIATHPMTVNGMPSVISGGGSLCTGDSGTLSNATPGGVWSSISPSVATVDATTGEFAALSPGTAIISYTLGVGCAATTVLTVNIMPGSISGVASVCAGYTTTLTSSPSGGSWSSSNTAAATVLPSIGVVSGVAGGTSTITYGFPSGCQVHRVVTISPMSATIAGTPVMCEGGSTTLSDPASGGGMWSTSNAAIASVVSATGVVTGAASGTATITYTIGSGCVSTRRVTVNPNPSAISGVPSACVGLTTSLSSASAGGTWSSGSPGVATIDASSGLVTGIVIGTTSISYELTTGCKTVQEVTVNPSPGTTTGTMVVCAGSSTTLANSVAGGVWSSGAASVATVDAASGVVTGVTGGTATITYLMGEGCMTTSVVTVYPVPAAISGAASICQGQTNIYANTTSGGIWSSGAASVLSISGASGIASAVSPGTAIITYTIGTGCSATKEIIVNPLASNSGLAQTCVGFSTTLSNPLPGGVWISSLPSVASVDGGGVILGVAAGTTIITYQLPTGCRAFSTVTVSAVSPIAGSSDLCAGQPVTFTNSVSSGTWESSDGSIVTVDAGSGLVSGIAAGIAEVSYSYGGGCVAVKEVTVNPLAPISGPDGACTGQLALYTDAVAGGTWSSAATTVSIDASTGELTGVAVGTAVITYRLPSGCAAQKEITVNPLSDITGIFEFCEGAVVSLANATPGGTWSSGTTAVAGADAVSGDISGLSSGTAVISYGLSTGCTATREVTVNPLPTVISGSYNVCLGFATTLSSSPSGGTWSSSDVAIAAVDASGVVSGIAVGTVDVTYTLPTGCYEVATVTVNNLPAPIGGSLPVCRGDITTLYSSTTGGTWSSGDLSIATVDLSTGSVSGIAPGTATITYTMSSGCTVDAVVTVNPLPPAISGPDQVCVGEAVMLSNSVTGGTWSCPVANVSVDASSGRVTGVSAGLAGVVYTLPTGCRRVLSMTVNPPPAAITGPLNVCLGNTSLLGSAPVGGTWATDDATIASIDGSSGLVTAVSAGTAVISYTIPTGCSTSEVVTVNPLPGTISGSSEVCQGQSVPFAVSTVGGTWSSSTVSTATVDAAGVVTGVAPGSATISYILPTGCIATKPVIVNAIPAPVTGAASICIGQTTTLTDLTPGGVWISSSTGVATVDAATGEVAGIAAGTSVITYLLATGCVSVRVVSVNITPAGIAGPSQVCTGASITLSDAVPGGTWASGTPGVATVSSGGVVAGVAEGVVTITYTLSSGCKAVAEITVNPIPPLISGAGNVCPGETLTLSNAVAGGTWSSVSPAIASVDAVSGMVTGITSGVSAISYILPTGCATHAVVIVDPVPAPITGPVQVCAGGTAMQSTTATGGSWFSSIPAIASIDATTGFVTGVSAGVAMISYRTLTGCASTRSFTVNPIPPAITGSMAACLGAATELYNAFSGGTWSSGDVSVASVGSTTGSLTGVALGATLITYTMPTGCFTTTLVSVHPLPATISGTLRICQGNTTLLTSATPSGIWSSMDTTIVTANAVTGEIAGISAGTAVVAYTLPSGCSVSAVVTVDALLPITGTNNFCAGDTVHFSCGIAGGTWSSSTLGVATVADTGVVSGITAGVAIISYSLASGCVAIRPVTVNQLPVAYFVTGGGSFCTGGSGVPVGLSGSVAGFGYHLNNGGASVAYMTGTGSPLDFGLHAAGGTYGITAVNLSTGCARNMAGSAVVSPVPMGPAGVAVSSSLGDTVCNGSAVTFTPVTYLAGASPTFQWFVNNVAVGGASSYSYTPADGDTVSCKMNSSASCAVPDTAFGFMRMAVLPIVVPAVNVAVTPDDTVCTATAVGFSATTSSSGTAPLLRWMRNGVFAATGATYSYTPADGDEIVCEMVTDVRCSLADTTRSSAINMKVLPYVVPSVTINAAPGLSVEKGQEMTFTAIVANAGATPSYQWLVNGSPVGGATSATYVTGTLENLDTVACRVTGSDLCSSTSDDSGVVVQISNVGVGALSITNGLVLSPNPNTGTFTISGQLIGVRRAQLKVTDVLGRVVYDREIVVSGGRIKENIDIGKSVANGMYMLTVYSGMANAVFHFSVAR